MSLNVTTLSTQLESEINKALRGTSDIPHARLFAYLASKTIYMMNSQVRYFSANGRNPQVIPFFEPPKAAAMRRTRRP